MRAQIDQRKLAVQLSMLPAEMSAQLQRVYELLGQADIDGPTALYMIQLDEARRIIVCLLPQAQTRGHDCTALLLGLQSIEGMMRKAQSMRGPRS